MTPQQIMPYAIPLVIFAVLAIRRRKAPPRHLRHDRLWVVPIIFGLLIAFGLYFTPHGIFDRGSYALLVVAGVAGAGVGWVRAHSVDLHLHPDDGRIMMATGNLATLVLLVLFLVRSLARNWALSAHVDLGLVTDMSMVFALGLILAQRVELWRRSQHLRRGATA